MNHNQLQNIERLEDGLWEAADNLRANSKLTSSEYCMPVLGVIFLRHATNRYVAASRQIAGEQSAGKMPKRPLLKQDFIKRRALMLPKENMLKRRLKQAGLADSRCLNSLAQFFLSAGGSIRVSAVVRRAD